MAVVTVKGTYATNRDAQPRVLNQPWYGQNEVQASQDLVVCGAADSANSVYVFQEVKSNDVIKALRVINDANTSGTSYKFGVRNTTALGAALPVANSDQIFGSAITMASARAVWTELYSPSILNAGFLSSNVNLRIWELLGLAADSQATYDLIMTAVTPGSAGGNVAVQLLFVR